MLSHPLGDLPISSLSELIRRALERVNSETVSKADPDTGERMEPDDALEWLCDELDLGELSEIGDVLCTGEAREIMICDGFEGATSDFGAGVPEYSAFDSEQIKFATGNQGTFDPTNPDIR